MKVIPDESQNIGNKYFAVGGDMYNVLFALTSAIMFALAYISKIKEKPLLKGFLSGLFALTMSVWAVYIPPDWNPITMLLTSCIFIIVICASFCYLYYKKGGNNKVMFWLSLVISIICVVLLGGILFELLGQLYCLFRWK